MNSKDYKYDVQDIVKNGDKSGMKTEKLINDILKNDPNLELISGTKYGSNNGFDHVVKNMKTGEIWIIDSKQIATAKTLDVGSIRLPIVAEGQRQLSGNWINSVVNRLGPTKAKLEIETAIKRGRLRTAVAGVNRKTGEVIIIPVNVKNNK